MSKRSVNREPNINMKKMRRYTDDDVHRTLYTDTLNRSGTSSQPNDIQGNIFKMDNGSMLRDIYQLLKDDFGTNYFYFYFL